MRSNEPRDIVEILAQIVADLNARKDGTSTNDRKRNSNKDSCQQTD